MIVILPPDNRASKDNNASTMKHRAEADVRREALQSLIRRQIPCRNVHFVREDMLPPGAIAKLSGEIVMVSLILWSRSDKEIVERVIEAIGNEGTLKRINRK